VGADLSKAYDDAVIGVEGQILLQWLATFQRMNVLLYDVVTMP
jgi:hypothetical protein